MRVDRKRLEAFLAANGWTLSRTRASHSAWSKPGALRPAVIDLNYDEVPEDHTRSILKAMGKTRSDLRAFLAK